MPLPGPLLSIDDVTAGALEWTLPTEDEPPLDWTIPAKQLHWEMTDKPLGFVILGRPEWTIDGAPLDFTL